MIYNYIQGFRLINAIVRSLPAANIETLLTDEVRASAFTKACGFYSQQSRFLETPLALQNLALSAKAYALLPEGVRLGILNDQTAIQNLTATILGEDPATFGFDDISQFVGDQAVMGVVFSSEPASQVIAASATAMNAIVNSGAALSVLWGKAPAIAALKISDVGRKAFVDSTNYADVFKPAVQKGILADGMLFTASGTFSVPAYVTKVHVVCIGTGGAGGSGGGANSMGGAGGAGGGALRWGNSLGVTPNQQIAVSVGAPSSFGTVIAGGGGNGTTPGNFNAGTGGVGGTGSGGNGGGNGGAGGNGGSAGPYSGGGGGGNGQAGSYDANGFTGGNGGSGGQNGQSGDMGYYGSSGTATSGYGAPGYKGYDTSVKGQPGTGICGGGGGYGGIAGGGGGAGGDGGPGVGSSPYGPGVAGDYGTRGKGVVRVIWGASRAFPSTNVEKIV